MFVVIYKVVGEFKFVKRYDLFYLLLFSVGWVRVNVYFFGYIGVCFVCY